MYIDFSLSGAPCECGSNKGEHTESGIIRAVANILSYSIYESLRFLESLPSRGCHDPAYGCLSKAA